MTSGSWTVEEDDFLKHHHGTIPLGEIGSIMGRSNGSIRGRITRLGISKFPSWSQEEEAELVEIYHKAGADGVLNLKEFCKKTGRHNSNVCRKAKLLGLVINQRRRTVDQRKIRERKYATNEELRAAISERTKRMIRENGHPCGMKGKKHSDETRLHLSRTSKAANLFLTQEQRSERVFKSLKTRTANTDGSLPAKVKRGSWQAGWREIGGKRNFYRSRWEANYARYLEWLKTLGEITEWQHEPETFWFEEIRRGVRSYKPDFRVWEKGGSTLHEVKGWMDDRSRVCLKRMAKYYPHEKIVLVDGRQYRAIRLKVMRLVPDWEDSKRDNHA